MSSVTKRTWQTRSGQVRTAWIVSYIDKDGIRQRRQFQKKGDADIFRIEIDNRLNAGNLRLKSAKMRISGLAELYLGHCRQRVQDKAYMTMHNYRVYEGHVKNYICPDPARHPTDKKPSRMKIISRGIGHLVLVDLSRRDILDFAERLREAGVSHQTARKIIATARQMLAYAVDNELIVVNPAADVRIHGKRDEKYRKVIPPTREEIRAIVSLADPAFRLRVIFAAVTGVRAGELHALQWRHVNCRTGFVTIEQRVDRYGEVDVTKTAAGMRDIPLGDDLVELLKGWKSQSAYKGASDLVFPDEQGNYMSHDTMIKRWYDPIRRRLEARARSGGPLKGEGVSRLNFHSLRHYAISSWIDAGLPPKTVQTFAGHSSIQVTMDRYGHLFPREEHKEVINALYGKLR